MNTADTLCHAVINLHILDLQTKKEDFHRFDPGFPPAAVAEAAPVPAANFAFLDW